MDIKDYTNELFGFLNSTTASDSEGEAVALQSALNDSVSIILDQAQCGCKVIIVGNGGSASIANHMAIDLWKNCGIRAVSFSDSSLLTCIGNDYGYQSIFEKPIEMFADRGDVVIAISSSGMSENILRAVSAAKESGCEVITMSGFKEENKLRLAGDINFFVSSGSYGYVEVSHSVLCHYVSDMLVERNAANG